jgi:UDP-N-acetyl-D-glucosamine dehydrogenase
VKWNRRTLGAFDAVVIATAHDAINFSQLADWAKLIVDTRNVMSQFPPSKAKVWKA